MWIEWVKVGRELAEECVVFANVTASLVEVPPNLQFGLDWSVIGRKYVPIITRLR